MGYATAIHRRLRQRYLEHIAPDNGLFAYRPKMRALRDAVPKTNPVIVDGGAYTGDTTAVFLESFPEATVHAIDAHPDHCTALRDRYADTDRVTVHEAALADASGTAEFTITEHSHSSSLFSPTDELSKVTSTAATHTITVQQQRLDDFVKHADVIKLDLQGAELAALRGAKRLLEDATAVLSEVQFVALYDGAALFGDIDAFLRENEFAFQHLFEPYTNDRLLWADALWAAEEEPPSYQG